MSIEHREAVRNCGEFRGNTRLLLFALADAASNGKRRKDGGKNLPFGWCSKSTPQMMRDLNVNRRETVVSALHELVAAGAVRRVRRYSKPSLTFVDINWLSEHSYAVDAESVSTGESTPKVDRKNDTESASTDDAESEASVDAENVSTVDTKNETLEGFDPVFEGHGSAFKASADASHVLPNHGGCAPTPPQNQPQRQNQIPAPANGSNPNRLLERGRKLLALYPLAQYPDGFALPPEVCNDLESLRAWNFAAKEGR